MHKTFNMKHLLLLLLIVLSFTQTGNAQSYESTQLSLDSLATKVNTLESNLNYLKVTYELNILRSELNIAASEANIKSLEMKIDIYHSTKFDVDLYNSYRDWNQSAIAQKESYSSLIEAKKRLVAMTILTSNFSDEERDLLIQTCGVIDNAFNSYEAALNMVQHILDVWKKLY